jgi:predicted transcriptional regulator
MEVKKRKGKKPLHKGVVRENLTETEDKVFCLITNNITPKRIRKLLNLNTRQALYYHISNLRKKGYLDNNNNGLKVKNKSVKGKGGLSENRKGKFRLHNEHFLINLDKYRPKSYDKLIGKRIYLENNNIVYNKENIEIYSNTSFFGTTTSESIKKSLE